MGRSLCPTTLPGETVEVEDVPGHPDRRQLSASRRASPQRIAPICPHFGICGGCAMQHWQTDAYRAWKRGLVIDALRQAGIEAPVADLIDAHGDGRRRVVFHARRGTHDVLEVGFSAARAHQVIAIDRCPVLAKSLDGALKAAWAIAELLDPVGKPLDIQATATDIGLDIDVRGSGPLTAPVTAALARLVAAAQSDAAYTPRRADRAGAAADNSHGPNERRCCRRPPFCRRQPKAKRRWRGSSSTSAPTPAAKKGVADLFAGVGPFALRLAEQTRVTASDDDEAALAALKRAATYPASNPSPPSGAICSKIRCLPPSSIASTPWYSIRRAKARKRKRARLRQAAFPPSPRCPAIRARSRATCGSWSMAATG